MPRISRSTLAAAGVLAAVTALAASIIPAAADNAPHGPDANSPAFWESYLSWQATDLSCAKAEPVATPYTVASPPAGWQLYAVVLKAGSGPSSNQVTYPQPGASLTHQTGKDISHAIVCQFPVQTEPTEPVASESPAATPSASSTPTVPVVSEPPAPSETPTSEPTVASDPSVTPPTPTEQPTRPGDVPTPDATPDPLAPPTEPFDPMQPNADGRPVGCPDTDPCGYIPADPCALGDAAESRMCETVRDVPLPVESSSASSTQTARPSQSTAVATAKPGLPKAGA